MFLRAPSVGLLWFVLASCSSSSTNPASVNCDPGEFKQCSCPGGGKGVAPCQAGEFGSCDCSDAGVGGAAGTAGTGGLGGSAGTGTDAGKPEPPSCKGLAPCVSAHSCCESPLLPAGTFQRDAILGAQYEAEVEAFRLDAFEVTVARFRNFVGAVVAGWKPASGSGKHQPNPVSGEPGWQTELLGDLWPTLAEWDEKVPKCQSTGSNDTTWSSQPGKNDNLPMNCVSFPQAYAFCIWDGGYLPTEAELSYAWVGPGKSPRVYPWGAAPVDPEHATYGLTPQGTPPPVGSKPLGASPLGHYDLFGSLFEFALDHYQALGSYPLSPCKGCAHFSTNPKADRAIRGGGWVNLGNEISAGSRLPWFFGGHNTGFRCARPPS